MRRLIELARKDGSEKMLVRATVTQLVVNWAQWYGGGFAAGVTMLEREGYTLPPPMQDSMETPRGAPGASDGGKPTLLGPANVNAKKDPVAEAEASVKAEMSVMREDLEVLRRALQARKAGNLSNVELAEARQACNDCAGWLQRLAQLLGAAIGGQATLRLSLAQAVSGRCDRDPNASPLSA